MSILNQIVSQVPFLHTQVNPVVRPNFASPQGITPAASGTLYPNNASGQSSGAQPPQPEHRDFMGGGGSFWDSPQLNEIFGKFGIDPNSDLIDRWMRHHGGGADGRDRIRVTQPRPAGGGASGGPSGLMSSIMNAFGSAAGGLDPTKLAAMFSSIGI